MKQELKIFAWLPAVFVGVYFLPVGTPRFDKAVFEALELTKWYAREHVILCLLASVNWQRRPLMKTLPPSCSPGRSVGSNSITMKRPMFIM